MVIRLSYVDNLLVKLRLRTFMRYYYEVNYLIVCFFDLV